MAESAQVLQIKTPQIIISKNEVPYSMISGSVPVGHMQVTLDIVLKKYLHDAFFREELCRGPVWIAQKGLDTSGYKEILDDYSFAKVSKSGFYKLPRARRSFHNKGGGFLTVDSRFGGGCLNIETWLNSDITARVAYIKDENAVHAGKVQELLGALKRV